MRTTLDIDDDILTAAKELAAERKSSAGKVLSDLARQALTRIDTPADAPSQHGFVLEDGWYVLPSRGGIVTNELVEKIQRQLDDDDARAAGYQRSPRSDG